MMDHRVVSDNGLTATPGGFDIDIRLPWYRTLPLSVVDVAEVSLDGQAIPLDQITFEINGATHKLGELRPRTDDWWFVLDSALLHVNHPGVEQGSTHEVAVTVKFAPPYIPVPFIMTRTAKTLVAN
jgi:hypothetical protein